MKYLVTSVERDLIHLEAADGSRSGLVGLPVVLWPGQQLEIDHLGKVTVPGFRSPFRWTEEGKWEPDLRGKAELK